MKVTFEFERNDSESTTVQNLSEEEIEKLEVIGKCPICKSDVVASDSYYACKGYFNKKCKLRISKKMLERDIPLEEIKKILTDGETNILDNFRSKRTGKLFSASLLLQKDGKIRFKFK